jgi:PAS domain S-box-containing protein
MSTVLVTSILIRFIALLYAIKVSRQIRDWRLGFLAVMLAMMLSRQGLTLWSSLNTASTPIFQFSSELPGLVVSIMAFLAIYFLGQLLTEQRRSANSINRYFKLVNSSLNEIYLFDADSLKFIQVNPSGQKNLGYSMEELKHMTPLDIEPEYTKEQFENIIHSLRSGQQEKVVFETVHKRKDNSRYDVEVRLQFMKEEGLFFAITLDISDQKHAMEKLEQSERRLRAVIDAVPAMIFVKNREGRFLIANKAVAAHFRKDVEEINGELHKNVEADIALMSAILEEDKQLLDGNKSDSVVHDHKTDHSGQALWIQTHKIPYRGEGFGEPVIVGCGIDITSLKEAQENLLLSESFLYSIINGVADPIYVKDEHYKYIVVNNTACELTALSRDDFIGKGDQDIFPADLAEEFFKQDQQVFRENKTLIIENKMQLSDGTHIISASKSSFINPISGKMNLVGTVRDITSQRNMEEALRRSQKMEALGKLTGGIAHDFNNILGIILGNIELIKAQDNIYGNDLNRINAIEKAANRAAALTKQLLSSSQVKPNHTIASNINHSLLSMNELIAGSLTPSIVLEKKLANDLWSTKMDVGDFEDALLNLTLNAKDAMPDGGQFVLTTNNTHLDECFCKNLPDITPGDYVHLSVSDTGIGMPKEIEERIYEPFFTTKARDKGTGLGLAMVFGFVQRSGGYIQVESEFQQGTTFHIYLPRSNAEAYNPQQPKTEDMA